MKIMLPKANTEGLKRLKYMEILIKTLELHIILGLSKIIFYDSITLNVTQKGPYALML